jgi:hypothetical protein
MRVPQQQRWDYLYRNKIKELNQEEDGGWAEIHVECEGRSLEVFPFALPEQDIPRDC